MLSTAKDQENPEVTWFRIYYGDDSTWTSDKDGPWDKASDTDVQVVLLWRADKNTRIMYGRDYYWLDSNTSTTYGQTDTLSEVNGIVKFGKWTNDWPFNKILWEALLDERDLYYGVGTYDRSIPPMPDYLLIDRGSGN